jgi:integrase/recombinase XerD
MRRPKRWASEADFQRLLSALSPSQQTLRAMLLLMYDSGLRISEAVACRWRDIHPRLCSVTIPHGKGGKRRTTWATTPLLQMRRAHRHSLPSPIYPRTVRTLQREMRRLCRRARVKYTNPHGLRHSFATNARWSEVAGAETQAAMGHTNPAVTEIYTHPHADIYRRAAARIELALGRSSTR